MTTATDADRIPEWDVADRMRKALRVAGVGVQEMATYLEVSRVTVGTWINGRHKPSPQTLRLWAIRCGVSYDWLRNGAAAQQPPEPPVGFEPTTYRLGVRKSPGDGATVSYLPARRLTIVDDEHLVA